MRKILCFGDSNTYGYDPADWTEGRYPAEVRWTDNLARHTAGRWIVIEEGLNGRKIPVVSYSYSRNMLLQLLERTGKGGLFCVMLGTNDILSTGRPDARIPVRTMDELLRFLTEHKPCREILILAPPYIGSKPAIDNDPMLYQCNEESRKMNRGFALLAEKYGVRFEDTGTWEIDLCYDQVHFSEAGHRRFAERMEEVLAGIESATEE